MAKGLKLLSISGIVLLVFFLLQLIAGVFIIKTILQDIDTASLQKANSRILDDISYKNGTWNMSRYNSDPMIPGAGTDSLYIITNDGFVLDRLKPISGFLDTADFSRLSTYSTPTTINSPSSQTWRVLSKPIIRNGNTLGVITVGYYNPVNTSTTDTDNNLNTTLDGLEKNIIIDKNQIITNGIDPRNINYDISYEIVNNFNKVIAISYNTNSIDRMPTYIDRSYVGNILSGKTTQVIYDSNTNTPYITYLSPIKDNSGNTLGIVVSGKSISYWGDIIKDYIIAEAAFAVFVLGLSLLILSIYLPNIVNYLDRNYISITPTVKRIYFDSKNSTISIDNKKIQIPYATNQYYLCELLFSDPLKKWESDEILEKFGISFGEGGIRKVYDTMIAVNKKTQNAIGKKLMVSSDKTYCINPEISTLVN